MHWEVFYEGTAGEYWEVRGKECLIWMDRRPLYCDRGNWLARIDAQGRLAREMDSADLWPRYYFDLDRAKAEIEAWLIKRGQVLPESGNF